MNLKNPNLYLVLLGAFILIFGLFYLRNPEAPDRMSRALMNGAAASIGLFIGLWFYNKNKDNGNNHQDFD